LTFAKWTEFVNSGMFNVCKQWDTEFNISGALKWIYISGNKAFCEFEFSKTNIHYAVDAGLQQSRNIDCPIDWVSLYKNKLWVFTTNKSYQYSTYIQQKNGAVIIV
jgi:hypothetical protein